MPRRTKNLRRDFLHDYSHVSTVPTMILVGALVGFGLGKLLARAFPHYETFCIIAGSLYGLAAGLYQAWKTLMRGTMATAPPPKDSDAGRFAEKRKDDTDDGAHGDDPGR